MPPPRPLTATPAPELDFSKPVTPASSQFGDIYFSVEGGLDESREVFLRGCGLPGGWAGRDHFVIGETGFGTGLNLLAAWHMWRESGQTGRLHFVSIEAYPLAKPDLTRALEAFPEVAELASKLIAVWPGRVRGVHRLEFSDLTLDLYHMEVGEALAQMDVRADAWFLDGFSPAKNPEMWSPEIMQGIAQRSQPGARVGTFTVAGSVRRGLIDAGFSVEKTEGFGRKRHRLEARLRGESDAHSSSPCAPIIIGAGIAGASVARAFLREGIVPTVIRGSDHMARAASANPAAMVKPRLDKQDRPESRFFLQAWLYARQRYPTDRRGIIHYATSEEQEDRFWALDDNEPLPRDHLYAADASLRFPTAPVIDPQSVCDFFLESTDVVMAEVTHWNRTDEGWDVFSGATRIASGTHLCLATGRHVKTALPTLNLRASRGQLSWAQLDLSDCVSYGGYAIPMGTRTLLGATHDRLVEGEDPYQLIAADDARNVEGLETHLGVTATEVTSARASVRVNSADTLPRMGEMEDGLYVLTALGSRGFSHAPLLGADLVAQILKRPGALTHDQRARFSLTDRSSN